MAHLQRICKFLPTKIEDSNSPKASESKKFIPTFGFCTPMQADHLLKYWDFHDNKYLRAVLRETHFLAHLWGAWLVQPTYFQGQVQWINCQLGWSAYFYNFPGFMCFFQVIFFGFPCVTYLPLSPRIMVQGKMACFWWVPTYWRDPFSTEPWLWEEGYHLTMPRPLLKKKSIPFNFEVWSFRKVVKNRCPRKLGSMVGKVNGL